MVRKHKPPTIADLPAEERPRERLLKHGADHVSNAELVAILLRTGTPTENVVRLAGRLLAQFGGLHGLAQAHASELTQIHGMGTAKAAQLIAALALGSRLAASQPQQRPQIRTAADAARYVMDMRYLPQEHVRLILLDNNSRVLATPTVYIGTVNTSVLRIAELFREAITRNSPALVLAHNHPNGNADPSPEDVELTRSLISAGEMLDIQVVDHIIIGERDWRSLREMGLAFERKPKHPSAG